MTYSSSPELNKTYILFNSIYIPNLGSPSVSVSVFLCFEYKKRTIRLRMVLFVVWFKPD